MRYNLSFLLVLFLLSACSTKSGVMSQLGSIHWYEDYGIPSKEALADTQYIPNLIQALKDENRRIVIYSAKALGKMGIKAESSLPALAELTSSDKQFEVRTHAIQALALVGKENPITLNTLSDLMLNDRHTKIRIAAARSFTYLGPSAAPAIPALIEALNSRHPHVRNYAAKTLAYTGPLAKDAVPILEELAKTDRNRAVQASAQEAVRRITYDERH